MDVEHTSGITPEPDPEGSLEEDLAAVTRVLLGVDAPEDAAADPAEQRRLAQRRQQQILDELRFLDD